MSERGRFRVYVLAFDIDGRTEGDFQDFRRALDALEVDFPGTQLLGCDETQGHPTYVIRETARATTEPEETP